MEFPETVVCPSGEEIEGEKLLYPHPMLSLDLVPYTYIGLYSKVDITCRCVRFFICHCISTQVVVTTADTLRATTREKVRRVVFAFYCNLLKKSPPAIAESYGIQMVTYKVLSVSSLFV